jgi:hypothetical protein
VDSYESVMLQFASLKLETSSKEVIWTEAEVRNDKDNPLRKKVRRVKETWQTLQRISNYGWFAVLMILDAYGASANYSAAIKN